MSSSQDKPVLSAEVYRSYGMYSKFKPFIDKIIWRHYGQTLDTLFQDAPISSGSFYPILIELMNEYATQQVNLKTEQLKEKEIRGDRMIVKLEHEKTVLQWKRQQLAIFGPILDFMQRDKSIQLGSSLSKVVLSRLESYDQLKIAADKMAIGLNIIIKENINYDTIKECAVEHLSEYNKLKTK